MKIIGIDGMTPEMIRMEVQRGGKFVTYQYCISLLVVTFKRPSPVYFRKANPEGNPAILYSILTLLLGWWGIPWGIIWTPMTIISNLRGGKDVTREVMGMFDTQNPVSI